MTKFVLIKYPQSTIDTLPLENAMPPDEQIGLTEAGRRVAQQIGERFVINLRGNISVWSGPAKRCAEPAKIIANTIGRVALARAPFPRACRGHICAQCPRCRR